MVRLDNALYWKYPGKPISCNILSNDNVEILHWPEDLPVLSEADKAAILKEYSDYLVSIAYKEKRAAAYPPIGDQLDNISKALKYMQAKGIDIGPDGAKQVADVEAVKAAYPKPVPVEEKIP